MATVYANVNDTIAHLPGVVREVANTAKAGARRSEAVLRAHRAEGHSRITVTHGDVDSFINLDDTRGQRAALAIEFGRSGTRGGGASQGVFALAAAF